MYHWMVYIHVLATFAFLLTHGVSSVVALRLRRQRDPAVARAWLQLNASGGFVAVFYGSLLTLLVSGVISGFMGDWWGNGWIWLALALLIGIIVAMFVIGTRHYGRVRRALGMGYFDGRQEQPAGEPAAAGPRPEKIALSCLRRWPNARLVSAKNSGLASGGQNPGDRRSSTTTAERTSGAG